MATWGDINSAIGLLGQARKDSTSSLLDAYRNRGKVLGEVGGRISDTLGGIAAKKFQAGEAQKGREHEIGMQTSEQNYQANENLLNRALERDKMGLTKELAEMDDATLKSEADLNRELERELQDAELGAENERQKADLKFRREQLAESARQFDEEMKRRGLESDTDTGLRERELGIRETEASARLAALQHEIDLENADPKVAAAYRSIIEQLKLDRPELFLGVDEAGYQYERGLRELSSAEKKELSTMFDDRVTTDYNDMRDGLFRLFNGALGEIGEDTTEPNDTLKGTNAFKILEDAVKGIPVGARAGPGGMYYMGGSGQPAMPPIPGKVITRTEEPIRLALIQLGNLAQGNAAAMADVERIATDISGYGEGDISALKASIQKLAKTLGVPDPLAVSKEDLTPSYGWEIDFKK